MNTPKKKVLAIGIIAGAALSIVIIGIVILNSQQPTPNYFTSIWDTTKTSSGSTGTNQIHLPLVSSGTYTFEVDWGDGTTDTITIWNQAETTHIYDAPGIYTLKISGTIIGWRFYGTGDRLKIHNITQWGCLRLGNTDFYFDGCANLNMTPVDTLDLTGTIDLFGCFWGCSKTTKVPHMDEWDVSHVTNMSHMFWSATAFNQSIEAWNVSSVTNMQYMFSGCLSFNQPLNGWNVSHVTNMNAMFDGCAIFNQPINDWDVSSVTSMMGMFEFMGAFNQPLGDWDVSSVSDMGYMFYGTDFDQDLGTWDVSSVTSMEGMFEGGLLSTANYDNMLIGWSAHTLQSGVTFHAGASSKYSPGAATTARGVLTGTYGWTITDGGSL